MKYAPDTEGRFVGQHGYGYRSIEAFIDAANRFNINAKSQPKDFRHELALIQDIVSTTAILEAGRLSLDRSGVVIPLERE